MPDDPDIRFKLTESDKIRLKQELLEDIASDLGFINSAGRADFAEFKMWWRGRKKSEERWGKIGVAIFTALTISGLLWAANFITANVHWTPK